LRSYNPCLACLSGAALVDNSRIKNGNLNGDTALIYGPSGQSNAYEEAMFVLGDSDEESDGSKRDVAEDPEATPASLEEPLRDIAPMVNDKALVGDATITGRLEAGSSNPPQYFVQPGDTIRGIALKYGIDVSSLKGPSALP